MYVTCVLRKELGASHFITLEDRLLDLRTSAREPMNTTDGVPFYLIPISSATARYYLTICKQLSECVDKENQCGKRVFAGWPQWLAVLNHQKKEITANAPQPFRCMNCQNGRYAPRACHVLSCI